MIIVTAQTKKDAEVLDGRTIRFDLQVLRQRHTITVDGVEIRLLGGFVSFDWAASLGLSPTFFAKHCRVKLQRFLRGKPFTQTLAWEDLSGPSVQSVNVRLRIAHEEAKTPASI